MEFVLDASVTLSWYFRDETTEAGAPLRDSLLAGGAFVPSLWPIEVGNALVVATRKGRISSAERWRICETLLTLPIEIESPAPALVRGATADLAISHRLTVYDASYLELAVRKGFPLATLDRSLAAAARSVGLGFRSVP